MVRLGTFCVLWVAVLFVATGVQGCTVGSNVDSAYTCNCTLFCDAFPRTFPSGQNCLQSNLCQTNSECVSALNDVWAAGCFKDPAVASFLTASVDCDGVGTVSMSYTASSFNSTVVDQCNGYLPLSMSASVSVSASISESASTSTSATTSASSSTSATTSASISVSPSLTPSTSASATVSPTTTPSVSPSATTSMSSSKSASMSASASPSTTPTPSPACDAATLCSVVLDNSNNYLDYNFIFAFSCLPIEPGSSCASACSNYSGPGNWTADCCYNTKALDSRCCSEISTTCQPRLNNVYGSNCWDLDVACEDKDGILHTVNIGSREDFESYWRRNISHPLTLPSSSPSPTPSVTPSTTPSVTPSTTPTPSITPTRSPTPSVTPTVTTTPSPTTSPSKLSGLKSDWIALVMCDNLRQIPSYEDSLPRDILWPNYMKWNDMDATVEINCVDPLTPYDCEWVVKTSVHINRAVGYAGFRVWSVYNDEGSDKVLILDNSYMFEDDAPCTVDTVPCPLLPLTVSDGDEGTSKAVYAEFHMALFNDTRTRPFVVEWMDESLIPHGMRPELGDVLVTFSPMPVPEGRQLSVSDVMGSSDLQIGVVVLCLFIGVLTMIMVASCLKKNVVQDKRQYVLDTEGFRTKFKPSKEVQIKHAQTFNRNRFAKHHLPFVFIVLMWRIAYSVLFTLSFFWLSFQTVNKTHYDTLDHWSNFTANRDSQILSLMRTIEGLYSNESTRITAEYNTYQDNCNVTATIEANFELQQDEIRAYHNAEIARLQVEDSQAVTLLVDSQHACSTVNATVLPSSLLVVNGSFVFTNGTTNVTTVEPVTAKLADTLLLQDCISTTGCSGYSFESLTNDSYLLFLDLPTEGDPTIPGFCSAYSTTYSDADVYQTQVAQGFFLLNTILDDLTSVADFVQFSMNTSASNFGWGQSYYTLAVSGGSGGGSTTTLSVRATYNCPDCDTYYAEPAYPEASNVTFGVNGTVPATNVSVSVQSWYVKAQNLSITVSEPDFSFLEPPTWDWDLYSINLNANIYTVVLGLDTLMLVYRTTLTIAIVSKYIRGIDKNIPATLLGKRADMRWLVEFVCCVLCFRFVRWCAKKMKNWDHTLWILFGRAIFLMQLCALLMIILIAYWVVDNAITVDTFDQFGVFKAMTAAPASQRTLRNEQLVSKAAALNAVGEAQFQATIYLEADSVTTRQDQFNSDQWDKVQAANDEHCSYVLSSATTPFVFQVDGSASGCCPTEVSSAGTKTYTFELDSPTIDNIDEYVAQFLTLTFSFDIKAQGSRGCYDPGVGDIATLFYRASLVDTNSTEVFVQTGNWTSNQNPAQCDATTVALNSEEKSILLKPNVKAANLVLTLTLDRTSEHWQYSLDSVSGQGRRGSASEINCTAFAIDFHLLDFPINDYTASCESVVPVSAYMIRLFDRDTWTNTLKESHTPFIYALRNIALSPFYIATVAMIVLVVVMLFLTLLEWLMVKTDLIRENTYARVPCVIANKDVVRMSMLEVQNAVKEDPDHKTPRTPKANTKAKEQEIEMTTQPPRPGPATPTELRHSNTDNTNLDGNGPDRDSGLSDGDWKEVFTNEGKPYYYNSKTGETSWEPKK